MSTHWAISDVHEASEKIEPPAPRVKICALLTLMCHGCYRPRLVAISKATLCCTRIPNDFQGNLQDPDHRTGPLMLFLTTTQPESQSHSHFTRNSPTSRILGTMELDRNSHQVHHLLVLSPQQTLEIRQHTRWKNLNYRGSKLDPCDPYLKQM